MSSSRRTKKTQEFEAPEEVAHPCACCQEEFPCNDPTFSKTGKFKCSCLSEKEGNKRYYFCSERCFAPDEEQSEDEEEQEDDSGTDED